MTAQFDRVARVVATHVAELLATQVWVVDPHGTIIVSSEPELVGHSFEYHGVEMGAPYLCVPLHCDGETGDVLVGKPLNGEVISPRLAQVLVELVINQTTLVNRLPNQHEIKNKFIYDLLHGLIDDEVAILREAQILGLDFAPPRAVILIDAADYIFASSQTGMLEIDEAQARRRAQFIVGSVVSFFHLPSDTICAYIGNGEVAVLKASDTKNLVAWVKCEDDVGQASSSWSNLAALKRAAGELLSSLSSDTGALISIGIGRHHPGVRGLAHSYEDARAALSLGRRFANSNQVYCLDSLGVAAFVGISDEHTKIDLATYLLGPLDHEPDLLKTLNAFFASDCCPSLTAKQLSIHRNTLNYRLDKIASLTGLDPRRFDDAVQVRLSLLLRSLAPS